MLQRFKTFLLLFISTISLVIAQEKGKIAGKVLDAASGEELIGVAVGIKGSSTGASSDIEGHYIISLLPGTYTLVVSYVGYKTKEISDVVITANNVVSLDISLEEAVTEMEEVVVTATFKRESVDALMLERKNSVAVSDGISSDLIKKTPDRNTSDVLKRITGATIQDNKFAIIRGLNERYNMALVNGTPLPSTESDKKAFAFDLFPANVLDKLEISKTASPDMPADFAGGIINITTKDIPDQNFLNIGIGASGNSITTSQDFQRSKGGKYDWLGFDDGTRKLPSDLPSVQQYGDYIDGAKYSTTKGYPWGYAITQRVEASKSFNNTWGSRNVKSISPAPQFQLTIGRTGKLLGKEVGLVGAINYQSNYRYSNIDVERYEPEETFQKRKPLSLASSDQYRVSIASGALLNLSIKMNDFNKLSLKNFFNQSSDDQVFYQNTSDISGNGAINYKYYANQYTSNRILSNQLTGEHFMPASKLKFAWTLANSKIERDIPDFKRVKYYAESGTVSLSSAANTVDEQSGSRFFSNTKENIRSANYSVSRDFKKLWNLNVKIGGFNQFRDRNVESRLLGYAWTFIGSYYPPPFTTKVSVDQDHKQIENLPVDQIFAADNMKFTGLNLINFNPLQSLQYNYTASSVTNAAYIMADIKPWEKLRLVGGVRVEAFSQFLSSYDYSKLAKISINTTKVDRLPSLSIIYSLNNKSNLRVSYSQTVNRPEFRELAPFPFYDFTTRYLVRGNPNLKRAYVYNYDLRYEFFPGAGQVFAVSTFYKYFENPIEFQEQGNNSSPDATYENINKAINYGVELEWRQNLQSLFPMLPSRVLDYSTVFANLTLINTRAYIDTSDSRFSQSVPVRALQGQSPYLLNTGYTFSNPKKNYSFNVSVNRNGPRIFIVGTNARPNVIEKPRTVIDLQVAKTFYSRLECKLTFGDIIGQHIIFYWDIDRDGKFKSGPDYIFSDATTGRNYSFAISYKF